MNYFKFLNNSNKFNKSGKYLNDVVKILNLDSEKEKKFRNTYMKYSNELKALRGNGTKVSSDAYKKKLEERKLTFLTFLSEQDYLYMSYFTKGYYGQETSFAKHPANLKKKLDLSDDQFNKLARIEAIFKIEMNKIKGDGNNQSDVSKKLRGQRTVALKTIFSPDQFTVFDGI